MTPLQMAYQLIAAIVRRQRDDQWHWANELAIDALARGAKGPKATEWTIDDASSFSSPRRAA